MEAYLKCWVKILVFGQYTITSVLHFINVFLGPLFRVLGNG